MAHSEDGKTLSTRASVASLKALLDWAATIAMLITAAALLMLLFGPRSGPTLADSGDARGSTTLEGATTVGNSDAPIVLVEFYDLECQYCAQFEEKVWPELKARWVDTGEIQLAYRHLPLPSHRYALRAAQAAECAAGQGAPQPMRAAIFAGQSGLSDADLWRYAFESGLNVDLFDACMNGPVPAQIERDIEIARSLNVEGTPTFVVGLRKIDGTIEPVGLLRGAAPMSQFDEVLSATRERYLSVSR